jgi:acetyltransferase-like isoleucine patch superfamily enzyme
MDLSLKKRLRIGKNVRIDVDNLEIGDGVFIGDNVVITGPKISIGDYTMIRENTQILSKSECKIGMCCWIGQGVILDATDNLTIGNGVGIGAHSQLWTHIKFGDTLQGCRWSSSKAMVVEDDVWFVGHCLVSPVHVAAGSMAMLGSVVTQDMKANRIYAGVPAKDITNKVGPQFIDNTLDEKYSMLVEKLAAFSKENTEGAEIQVVKDWPLNMCKDVSYFNVSNRQYTKRLSDREMDFMLFLLVPIKFYPAPLSVTSNDL